MARYIGSLTSDARGKVGGHIHTRARSGTTLKAHGVGTNPQSNFQNSLRSVFGSAASAWRQLSQSNQTTWGLLAAQYTYVNSLGQSYSPTGLQLWTQAWVNAATLGATPPATAPVSPPSVAPGADFMAEIAFGDLNVGLSGSGGFPYTGSWSVSLSHVIPATLNYTRGIRRRPMGAANLASHIICTAAWRRAYGRLPGADNKLAYRVVPFDPTYFITGAVITGTVFII